jgi:UDPglucose 6-dehydrogenase
MRIEFAPDRWSALDGADALVIATEWAEFRTLDAAELHARMRAPIVFDGRNLYDPLQLAQLDIDYHCVGRPCPARRMPQAKHCCCTLALPCR